MPSGRESVGGFVRTLNDGVGTYVSRAEKRAGRVQGLRKGDGGGVTGHTPHITAWENQGNTVDLDRRSDGRGRRRGGANNTSDRVPQGGDEGVSSGRVPGKGRDTDGDEGAFLATTCLGRCDHLGGGKPPSSKMPTMRHDGPVAVTKWTPQEQSDVQEWGREEEAATDKGGGKRKHGDGLQGLKGKITDGP